MSSPGDAPPSARRRHGAIVRRAISALATLAVAGTLAAVGPALPVAAVGLAPAVAAATSSTARSDRGFAGALARFTATLGATQRQSLADATRGGLRLGDLDAAQRAALGDVMDELLSDEAARAFADIMRADAELDALEGGGSSHAIERYTVLLLDDGDGVFLQLAGEQVAVDAIGRDGRLVVDIDLRGA
jgi:hypothetical protein